MSMNIQSITFDRDYRSDLPNYLQPYEAKVTFGDTEVSYQRITVELTPEQVILVTEYMVNFAVANIAISTQHLVKPTSNLGSDGRDHSEEEAVRIQQAYDERQALIGEEDLRQPDVGICYHDQPM